MDEQLQKIIERVHQAQNILVTVSSNPTVDQLSAAIGLTVALNKLDKHGTAVFSGKVPSTIEFLKPEETLEKNTNSLRDFIIALDKSKADKLRYKVEDQVVRIFITPYRTSLSQDDLQFSQGDFNVDVVLALGVTEQQDLDAAITAHGRILHDATVVSVTTTGQGSLGSLNWVQPKASSLSEMMVELINGLDKKVLDNQIATALLTGIVASTERFSNDKTSPKTMSASAVLMAAGANQQLIATQLETPAVPDAMSAVEGDSSDDSNAQPTKKSEPGMLEIDHEGNDDEESQVEPEAEEPQPQVRVDDNGQLITEDDDTPEISAVRGVDQKGNPAESEQQSDSVVKRERMVGPPQMGDNDITANSKPEAYDLPTEELTLPAMDSPLLSHNQNVLSPTMPPAEVFTPPAQDTFTPPSFEPAPVPPTDLFNAPEPIAPPLPPMPPLPVASTWSPSPSPQPVVPDDDTTLAEIEQSVGSPHLQASYTPNPAGGDLDQARSAVEAALNASVTSTPEPIAALNAQPLGVDLHPDSSLPPQIPSSIPPSNPMPSPAALAEPIPGGTPSDTTLDMPLPANPFGPGVQPAANPLNLPPQPMSPSAFPGSPQPGVSGQTPPPPVPPPMLPPLQ